MKKSLLIYSGIAVLLVGGGLVAYFLKIPVLPVLDSLTPTSAPVRPSAGTYTNDTFRFSLSVPEGYQATELPDEGQGSIILIQNKAGDGIQVLVKSFGADLKVITAEMVQQDIPDMKITDVQTVDIGNDYKGIAFRSDNEAFGGDSREVWFVYKSNLYQISTYARLDPLLKSIFATWKFF